MFVEFRARLLPRSRAAVLRVPAAKTRDERLVVGLAGTADVESLADAMFLLLAQENTSSCPAPRGQALPTASRHGANLIGRAHPFVLGDSDAFV